MKVKLLLVFILVLLVYGCGSQGYTVVGKGKINRVAFVSAQSWLGTDKTIVYFEDGAIANVPTLIKFIPKKGKNVEVREAMGIITAGDKYTLVVVREGK